METTEINGLGSIHISQRAVSIIASMTAAGISGVSLGATIAETAAKKMGHASLSQGAAALVEGQEAEITIRLVVTYGYRIPDIALQVQKSVKDAVEVMTGCHVTAVHIMVQDIDFSQMNAISPKDAETEGRPDHDRK